MGKQDRHCIWQCGTVKSPSLSSETASKALKSSKQKVFISNLGSLRRSISALAKFTWSPFTMSWTMVGKQCKVPWRLDHPCGISKPFLYLLSLLTFSGDSSHFFWFCGCIPSSCIYTSRTQLQISLERHTASDLPSLCREPAF